MGDMGSHLCPFVYLDSLFSLSSISLFASICLLHVSEQTKYYVDADEELAKTGYNFDFELLAAHTFITQCEDSSPECPNNKIMYIEYTWFHNGQITSCFQ